MSKVLVDESSLHGVGNGIRYVNGENTTYKPSEFENAIKDLKPNLGTKTLTENGTFPASDDDLDGFSSVKVAVPPTSAVLVEKTITENGDYDPTDDDADGYSAVSVEVPNSYTAQDEGKVVSNGALISQTVRYPAITENGVYGTETYSQVIVAVSGYSEDPSYAYYNGYLLPKVPTVDGYNYWWIRKNEQTGYYDLLMSPYVWYTSQDTTVSPPAYLQWNLMLTTRNIASNNKWYRCPIVGADSASWTEYTPSDGPMGTGNNRGVIFSNEDILYASDNGNTVLRMGFAVPHYISGGSGGGGGNE